MTQHTHVILLHGLARSSQSMRALEAFLQEAGYPVLNLDYPSRKETVEACAHSLLPILQKALPEGASVALVSHSMGGLVGRELMSLLDAPVWSWESAVFIAPPHQGSQVAKTLAHHPATQSFFRWFYGPAGLQVTEAMKLPLPPCPFGVIAGNVERSFVNPTSWISPRIFPAEERSDGTVAVSETHLEDMVDWVEVRCNHTTIMKQPEVHDLVLYFLQNQSFPKEPNEEAGHSLDG